MRFRFFAIPLQDSEAATHELNQFIAAHRLIAVDRQFVADGANSQWALCVSFAETPVATVSGGEAPSGRRGKIDFKDVLDPDEFAVFSRLRALRKERADAEGIPAYAVFTNEQLAAMVQRRVTSATALREMPGIGEARTEKYGAAFLHILTEAALPAAIAVADEA